MSTYQQPLRHHLESLTRQPIGRFCFDAPLADLCSWRIGGPADLLVLPDRPEQVATVVRFAQQHAIPLLVIGQGSNLLFDDAGLRGIVLKLGNNLSRLQIDGGRIEAEAGVWVPRLAQTAARAGLAGLEHIIGIPGTIGGLVLMNGGSQRQAIGDHVRRVRVVDREGELKTLERQDCAFAYRHSALQESGVTVIGVELQCPTGDPRQIRREMLADLRERRRKFPRKEPNCGSVFLSTAEMHASVGPPGRIIEAAGLKGLRVGGAEVSRRHANFIVNRGGATSRQVLTLIAQIRRTIREQIGFDLHCEVRYVTAQGELMPADRATDGGPIPTGK
ncbi:MAG: UDP-N-acetylmuramate dehydrogenase [Desulfuromonadales bacterium]|nr:UDP-N-acetylmuramate dehydrogenase [Desulfuromonadales bacterium]